MKALPTVGHFAAAVIYVTMGFLVGLLAFGARAQTPDLRGSVRTWMDQPFGPVLLLVVCAGSIALVAWRLLQAFADLESKGRTFLGLLQRSRYLASGLFYIGLPILVWRMLIGAPVYSSDHWARQAAHRILQFPFGWTLLVATGAGFFVYSTVCLYRFLRGNFEPWFKCEEMTKRQRYVLFLFGRLGYAARGSISFAVGYFVLLAGWHTNPTEVAGQASALNRIFHEPFGPFLLGVIAAGLISLGIFSIGAARFGKIPLHRLNQLIGCWRRPEDSVAEVSGTASLQTVEPSSSTLG